MSFRSPKLLKSAKDQPCVLCGSVGTTIAAHSNRVCLGKGKSIKAPDYFTAWVCQHHHDQIDGRKPLSDLAYNSPEEMWDWAFIKTVARWFELGIVKVK